MDHLLLKFHILLGKGSVKGKVAKDYYRWLQEKKSDGSIKCLVLPQFKTRKTEAFHASALRRLTFSPKATDSFYISVMKRPGKRK
jgi:hypothetical protein